MQQSGMLDQTTNNIGVAELKSICDILSLEVDQTEIQYLKVRPMIPGHTTPINFLSSSAGIECTNPDSK